MMGFHRQLNLKTARFVIWISWECGDLLTAPLKNEIQQRRVTQFLKVDNMKTFKLFFLVLAFAVNAGASEQSLVNSLSRPTISEMKKALNPWPRQNPFPRAEYTLVGA